MDEAATRKSPLDLITPLNLFVGLSVICLVIMLWSTCAMLSVDGPLPPPRDPPPPIEKTMVHSYRYKEGYYKALINEDARKVGIKGELQVSTMRAGNPYFAEFTGNQLLKVGEKLETQHLVMQALQKKVRVGEAGQEYRTDHLLLEITNKSSRPVAYMVTTEAFGSCDMKGHLSHNAIALEPRGRALRSECLARDLKGIRVKKVEVLQITPLGYHYVSRLDPAQLSYDPRTSAGHEYRGLPACRMLPWNLIQTALKRGEAKWYDVLDFYSRHTCDEYTIHDGHVWKEKGPERLPLRPPG